MAATPTPKPPPPLEVSTDAGGGARDSPGASEARSGAPALRDLFDGALELEPAARRAFIEAACGDDLGLLKDLLDLLEVEERSSSFMEVPIVAGARRRDAIPPRIGPYLPEEILGRGGMGIVYRARHALTGAPVALKTVEGL